jgi:hypothetical protein
LPPPTITIGLVPVPSDMDDLLPKRHSAKRGTTGVRQPIVAVSSIAKLEHSSPSDQGMHHTPEQFMVAPCPRSRPAIGGGIP